MPLKFRESGITKTVLDDKSDQTLSGTVDLGSSVTFSTLGVTCFIETTKEVTIPHVVNKLDSAWGSGDYGQLGTGNTSRSCVPIAVCSSTSWSMISGGGQHSLALRASDGTAFAWGMGDYGQLGTGNTSRSCVPVAVDSSTSWSMISGGSGYSLAIRATDGMAFTWGEGSDGQLGTGNTSRSCVPVAVSSSTCWSMISAGSNHSLAISATDGRAFAWGKGYSGELGNCTVYGCSLVPVAVCGSTCWSMISGGGQHSLAIRASDGMAFAWGYGRYGELGNNSTDCQCLPVAVDSSTCWSMISGGGNHSLALRATDGTAFAWGKGIYGELGNCTLNCSFVPVAVCGSTCWSMISAGSGHSLAIRACDGTAFAWGNGVYGELGNCSTSNQCIPVAVCSSTCWSMISGGGDHSLALKILSESLNESKNEIASGYNFPDNSIYIKSR